METTFNVCNHYVAGLTPEVIVEHFFTFMITNQLLPSLEAP